MLNNVSDVAAKSESLQKALSGVSGLDEITDGGLPAGRPTLVCGGAGCGKTLLAMQFLVRGALDYGEPGVFMCFEETQEDIEQNFASLGVDLPDLEDRKLISIDFVRIDRSEIEETGEYDLEGLFVRLNYAIDSIGAKRVVLDTLEALFAGLSNAAILRAELRRLFLWLKEKGVTAVITGERGEGQLTRYGLEEYVSDCVILLDHRVNAQISTRRLRIVKYRGSTHGTNEYPFVIGSDGISVVPITSLRLDYPTSEERVSTGISRLDDMLMGGGYYRGSSILLSGAAGTGKSSIAAHFAACQCRHGESVVYFAFEESHREIIRNMRSIGIGLQQYVDQGLLHFAAIRPTIFGLEMHLASMHKYIEDIRPTVVILDPVTSLLSGGEHVHVHALLMRLLDFFKSRGITALFTSLVRGGHDVEEPELLISSLMDAWIILRYAVTEGGRTRSINVLKARGLGHSNEIRKFEITANGVHITDSVRESASDRATASAEEGDGRTARRPGRSRTKASRKGDH